MSGYLGSDAVEMLERFLGGVSVRGMDGWMEGLGWGEVR